MLYACTYLAFYVYIHCSPQNYFKKIWNFVEFLSTTGAILEFILQQTVISDSSDVRAAVIPYLPILYNVHVYENTQRFSTN